MKKMQILNLKKSNESKLLKLNFNLKNIIFEYLPLEIIFSEIYFISKNYHLL